ncbi:MAG: rane protein [Candidatus Saccharibacteria bacterium]|nr:rane protein [Candidatus Saccharibacteria bacterium]
MIQKIKNIVLALVLPLTFALPVIAVPSVAFADVCGSGTIGSNIANGANSTTSGSLSGGCQGDTSLNENSIASIGKKVVTIFSYIVGVISILMIIYGGFRYITSGGDSGNVGNAKNTIIYALIGLIIVALAQAIVHFVLNTTNTTVT